MKKGFIKYILLLLFITIGISTNKSFYFKVTAAVPPQISSISPMEIAVGVVPAKLKISGSGFDTSSKVFFNGKEVAALIKANGKKITIKQSNLPVSLFSANGQVSVQVINSDGQSSDLVFIKVGTGIATPVVTAITPDICTLGADFDATISGRNLNNASQVSFNTTDITAQIIDANRETELLVRIKINATANLGDYTFTITTPGGVAQNDSVSLAIQQAKPSVSVKITTTNPVVEPGKTVQLRAEIVDNDGNPTANQTIDWNSDDPEVATIDNTGLVTGVKAGFVTINARVGDLAMDSTPVNVVVIEDNPTPEPVGKGQIVLSSKGQIFLTDPNSHTVRIQESFNSLLEIYAGSKNRAGNQDSDSERLKSLFNTPFGVAIDENNQIMYVADVFNQSIRQINMTGKGAVKTLVTSAMARAIAGVNTFGVRGVAVDQAGRLFITDSINQVVWLYDTNTNTLKLLAGSLGEKGLMDGSGTAARFNSPQGVQMDNARINAIVADTGNSVVRLVTPDGDVATVAANISAAPASATRSIRNKNVLPNDLIFTNPRAVAADPIGNIIVASDEGAFLILIRDNEPFDVVPILPGEVSGEVFACEFNDNEIFLLGRSPDTDVVTFFRIGMPNAEPQIDRIEPDSIALGQPTNVLVFGNNFAPDTRVTINDEPIPDVEVLSSTAVSFLVKTDSTEPLTLRVETRVGSTEASIMITPPSSVAVEPSFLNFVAIAGEDSPQPQQIRLSSTTTSNIIVRILSVLPPNFSPEVEIKPNIFILEPGGRANFTVSVNTQGMPRGEYDGLIILEPDDGSTPVQIGLKISINTDATNINNWIPSEKNLPSRMDNLGSSVQLKGSYNHCKNLSEIWSTSDKPVEVVSLWKKENATCKRYYTFSNNDEDWLSFSP
ncbi:MAG: IPT/TIG domain-containing protein [Acidobacteriota bacterium]